ncbi:MAG TPA: oligoribonuclease, partial [Alcanivorax sp.]|nr:oligoribonuclease [Alcanivorax sp.]
TEHHNNSGLVERVRKSDLDDAEAERRTLVFLEQYVEAGMSPMCGNSI